MDEVAADNRDRIFLAVVESFDRKVNVLHNQIAPNVIVWFSPLNR